MPDRDLDWYKRVGNSLSEAFSKEFGYELVDVYDDICDAVAEDRPVTFSRFGDGELYAVFGADGENCDGHRYFPDMGDRLGGILAGDPPYLMGLNPVALAMHGADRLREAAPGVRWVSGHSISRALLDDRLTELVDALARRSVLLVGPAHLHDLSRSQGWAHLSIPSRNCWTQYTDIIERLRDMAGESGEVILFCASMMSNVLIDDLYRDMPANSHIDIGSAFDVYAGVNSRSYHSVVPQIAPVRGK